MDGFYIIHDKSKLLQISREGIFFSSAMLPNPSLHLHIPELREVVDIDTGFGSSHPILPRNDLAFAGVAFLAVVVLPNPNFGFFSAGFSI